MSKEKPAPEKPAETQAHLPTATANGFPVSARPTSLGWSFTTLDRTTKAGRELAFRARDWDGAKLDAMIGKTIDVENLYINPTEYVDAETGEVTLGIHIALITPDGTLYHCGSKGVYNSLESAWAEIGPAPWKDPLVFEVEQVSSKPPLRVYKLRFRGRRSELGGAAVSKK